MAKPKFIVPRIYDPSTVNKENEAPAELTDNPHFKRKHGSDTGGRYAGGYGAKRQLGQAHVNDSSSLNASTSQTSLGLSTSAQDTEGLYAGTPGAKRQRRQALTTGSSETSLGLNTSAQDTEGLYAGTPGAQHQRGQAPATGSTSQTSLGLTTSAQKTGPKKQARIDGFIGKRVTGVSQTSFTISAPSARKTCPPHMRIFHNLYTMLAADTHRGFDKFTQTHTEADLLRTMDVCFRKPVKQLMAEENYTDRTKLLAIKGNTKSMIAGWYMDVVTDDKDITWFKLYVGQGERIKVRIDYHVKPSVIQKNKALHYELQRKPGRHYNYVVLAELPADVQIDTQLLDVIEMYLGLLFQALPAKTLIKYLPKNAEIRQPERGCNVSNPLNQHHEDVTNKRAGAQMRESTDAEVREHYKDAVDYLKKVEYVPSMIAARKKSKKSHLFRNALPGNDFKQVVMIKCSRCNDDKTIKRDPLPIFDIETDDYIVRDQSCHNCPVPGAKKGDRRQFKSVAFLPTDGRSFRYMTELLKYERAHKSNK